MESDIKKRPIQKESKKINCKAKLQISFDPADPDNVTTKYSHQHNHSIGSIEDTKHLTLSSGLKELIESQLSLGYDKRDVRVSLQKHFSRSDASAHRDHFVHADDIYNIYQKIEQQKDLLLQPSNFCRDAIHNTTNVEKEILYTIVTTHPNTGTGCPVAFFYTKDHSSDPLIEFLIFLKDLGLSNPTKVTIDVSHVELLALNTVYPDTAVQWRLFHVGRAWYGKIKEYIKCTSFHAAFYVIITIVRKNSIT